MQPCIVKTPLAACLEPISERRTKIDNNVHLQCLHRVHTQTLYYYGRVVDVILGLSVVVAIAIILPWYACHRS